MESVRLTLLAWVLPALLVAGCASGGGRARRHVIDAGPGGDSGPVVGQDGGPRPDAGPGQDAGPGPASCTNGLRDGDETDVDCGGSCAACDVGLRCGLADDCTSRVCTGSLCQMAGCADGVQNGDESDVDCGGTCSPCMTGRMCRTNPDCATGMCTAGSCVGPACDDGIHNGDETDVDCGGSCSPCANGRMCAVPSDCTSNRCGTDGTCAAPACDDGIQNGDETDVDCGGSCSGCSAGRMCMVDTDCASGMCGTDGTCSAPPSAMLMFPSMTSTVCSGGTCSTLGAGGGGAYYRTGDYIEQTFTGTGLTSVTHLDVSFDMDDLTSGCAVGQALSWNVLINGTVVGTYADTGGSHMGRFTITQSYSFAAVSGAGTGDQYTLRFQATTTVCPGGSSWNWYPGGTATLTP